MIQQGGIFRDIDASRQADYKAKGFAVVGDAPKPPEVPKAADTPKPPEATKDESAPKKASLFGKKE